MRTSSFAPLIFAAVIASSVLTCAQVPKNNLKASHPANRVRATDGVDLKTDPAFHQVLENQHVRIFKVGLDPLQSTAVDAHGHDYLLLSLGKSNFEVRGEGNHFILPMEDGEMQVLKGGWPHKIASLADTPLSLLEIEVLADLRPEHPICGLSGKECVDGIFGSNDEGTYTQSTLFETETVKVVRVSLGPGGVLPQHRHNRCHVLIALNDLQLRDDSKEAAKEQRLQTGETVWYSDAIEHQLKNLSKQDARLVTVEFK